MQSACYYSIGLAPAEKDMQFGAVVMEQTAYSG